MDNDEFLKNHPAETCDVFCMDCGDAPDYDYVHMTYQRQKAAGKEFFSQIGVNNCFEPTWFCQTHNKTEWDAP